MKISIEQIEVARDAWQEDEGVGDRWMEMLKGHPEPVLLYIRKRFEFERDELGRVATKLALEGRELPVGYQPRYRLTSLSYERNSAQQWEVTDNTPEGN